MHFGTGHREEASPVALQGCHAGSLAFKRQLPLTISHWTELCRLTPELVMGRAQRLNGSVQLLWILLFVDQFSLLQGHIHPQHVRA